MRLIGTVNSEQKARQFTAICQERNIIIAVEPQKEQDWGSADYGDTTFTIWVEKEDDLLLAKQIFTDFNEDPNLLIYSADDTLKKNKPLQQKEQTPSKSLFMFAKGRTAYCTLYIIALCTGLFFWTMMATKLPHQWPEYIPPIVAYPKIEKDLLYDFPHKLETAEQLIILSEDPENLLQPSPDTLSDEALYTLEQFHKEKMWQGIYPYALHLANPEYPNPAKATLFEKISTGEIWRLFSPALLHASIIHLLFNMLWLSALGTQIEVRLGAFRYLLFILVTAVLSNTAQYLMSGYNFLGFSGVITAMIGFVWARKKIAPWEGYLLQRSTLLFITVFIFGMAGLELLSFTLKATSDFTIPLSIANTAHVAGVLVGAAIGHVPFAQWK